MSGQMRHRMTVYSETSDDGSDNPAYTELAKNQPCNIVPVSGGESYRGRQIEATETHAIETRRNINWTPNMRIYSQTHGKYYNVQRALSLDGRRSMVLLTAAEVVQ